MIQPTPIHIPAEPRPGLIHSRSPRLIPLPRNAILLAALLLGTFARVNALDLQHAVIVHPPTLTRPEQKAVAMLQDEIEKRAHLRLNASVRWPAAGIPVIALGQLGVWKTFDPAATGFPATLAPEGFQIASGPLGQRNGIAITGADPRGVLFGVGQLLRQLRLRPGHIELPDGYTITSAPKYPLRGHQLGYRPKTHSYDAWDAAIWEQYYRDLIVFGANAVELIPPRSDDDADSPHFPLPPLEMMRRMSQLADDYGLDVWIWYPAMDPDYANPATVEAAIKEWRAVFEALPRIDAIFVPGGDPGHTAPRPLMALLEKQTRSLRQVHPKAQMWVSPQSFDSTWLPEFLGIIKQDNPDWLSGIVFGPQVRMPLPELRAAIPARYPIRHYPDITHSRQCQYPVPDWDVAFAITEGRECINPRPTDQAAIMRLLQPHTIGFISYSEGCNDDVNKAVWSALSWNPDQPVIDVLREFSRYFIGEPFTEGFAQGLLALEQNWRGPVASNAGIESTLRQFQAMEQAASPAQLQNWRFQQALLRAYYDAYVRIRFLHETALEAKAMESLREAGRIGPALAISQAETTLHRAVLERPASDLRERIHTLSEALFQSIRMQLSVPKYKAIAVDRGACLDTLDYPLNNRHWLLERFASIRKLKTEEERVLALQAIVDWANPGPGGFYDDLGNSTRQPHLVRGLPFDQDPASFRSSKTGFEEGDAVDEPDEKPEGALRMSWLDHAESLFDEPLVLHYTGLDPAAHYRVRLVYSGDSPKRKIRMTAGNGIEIHPLMIKEHPHRPLEFDLPPDAIRKGELTLSWTREPGLGGNGRGCQVAEVWIIRK